MTFLNAILLAGAAAFLIPLIIHLLNKRRVVTVRWGAMHLLHEALRQKKRNVKLEQLLLLLARIAIPILLALCLARPVLTWFQNLMGGSKSSLIVLLDNSFSMRAPGSGGAPRDRARDDLRRILEGLPQGSDANVILIGQPSRLLLDQPTSVLELLPENLRTEPSLGGPASLNDAFQTANAEFKRMGNASKEVLLISDFQQSDWKSLSEGGTLPALDLLKKQQPAPLLTFYRVGNDLQENLSVASVEPSAFVVAKEQSIALRVRIQNHGQRSYQDIAVRLEADGAQIRTTRISIAPNAETVLTMSHAFDIAGDHSLTVRVEGDSFPDDNAFSVVIPVRDQVNCLLAESITGTKKGPLEGATDFLEIALAPHHSAADKTLKDVIHTTIKDNRNSFDTLLPAQEVVILADIDRYPSHTLSQLQTFVERGGGLIIFAGPTNDLTWLDREFFRGGKGVFPCLVKGFGHVDDGQTPARILSQRFTHPATAYFNDARGLRLQDAVFQHWQKFDKIEGDARVLLSLDRGDALVVEKPLGKGRVIAIASSANAQWNNLPLQPVFVPLMQRLVTYLATQSAAPLSQSCGSLLRVSLRKDQAKAQFTLTDPQNKTHELKPRLDKEGNVFIETNETFFPGIYELRDDAVKSAPPKRYAFNLNSAESALQTLPAAKTKETATRLGASFAENHDDYARLDRTRRHGTEIWHWVLLAVLLFLFGEVFLQQRISRA
jgi:hypothetical protein